MVKNEFQKQLESLIPPEIPIQVIAPDDRP